MAGKKILFLVPNATMVDYVRSVLHEVGFPIPVAKGLWQEGVQITRDHLPKGLDVVIARGGTAQVIREANLGVSVVELAITAIDILHAVERAKIYGNRIAVVAFQSMVLDIDYIARIMDVEIGFFYIESAKDADAVVATAFARGYDAVLGGALAAAACRTHNLPFIFIESSRESIIQAALEAGHIEQAIQNEQYKRMLFSAVHDYAHDGIIIVDHTGRIISINPVAAAITKFGNATGQYIRDLWPELQLETVMATKAESLNEIHRINEVNVHCNKVPILVNNQPAGAIAAFQDVTKIQRLEARIRQQIYAIGHVAKCTFDDIWGTSRAISQAVSMAKDYSQTDSHILIQGETGTGKEVFAQSIHNHSRRAGGPFVVVNCAALPGQLLESELFAYVRGAFTGANKEGKPGLFEAAHGGTILLDEITELDYSNQGRLLRVLQEKAVVRLGSDRVIPVDVRVIAAANRDVGNLVAEKKFRDDLYYRINVLQLHLPPLRERKEDIAEYAKRFLDRYATANGRTLQFRPGALRLMGKFSWPGNVRQLQNTMERVAVISREAAVSEATLAQCLDSPGSARLQKVLAAEEITEITTALRQARGNHGRAAEILGINRTTLWRKIRRLGLDKEQG